MEKDHHEVTHLRSLRSVEEEAEQATGTIDELAEKLSEAIMGPSNLLARELDKLIVRVELLEQRLDGLGRSLAARTDRFA